MSFSIEIDKAMVNDIKSVLSDIKNGYKNVLVTSINKTLTTAKVQATARIGNEMNLKAARIKEDFTVQKANYSKISGAVSAKGKPVGLIQFGARDLHKGVSVQVLRSNPRTLLKHAFIARRGTKDHVFWRTGRDKVAAARKFSVGRKSTAAWPKFGDRYRMPLERLTGPRIEDIFAKPKVFDPVSIQAGHVFLQNVDAKLTEILRRHGG